MWNFLSYKTDKKRVKRMAILTPLFYTFGRISAYLDYEREKGVLSPSS